MWSEGGLATGVGGSAFKEPNGLEQDGNTTDEVLVSFFLLTYVFSLFFRILYMGFFFSNI